MQTRVALITLALAASASALAAPDAPAVTPPPLMLMRRAWEIPSDFEPSTDCPRAVTGIMDDGAPTPTGSLAVFFASEYDLAAVEQDIADAKPIRDVPSVCTELMNTPTPPASLASDFSAYQSSYSSWQSRVAPDASSVAAMCTGDGVSGGIGAAFELLIATDVPQCTAALNKYNSNSLISGAASTARPGYVAAVAGAAGLVVAFALF